MRFYIPLDSRSLKLAKTVDRKLLVDYVDSNGWKMIDFKTKFSDVYNSPKGKRWQVAIPRTTRIVDYAYCIAMVVAMIADYEGRDVDDVLDEFAAASAPKKKPPAKKKTAKTKS